MAASPDRQLGLVPGTLANTVRKVLERRDEARYHLLRDLWSATKRFGSRSIATVEVSDLAGIESAVVEAYVDDRNRAVLAALCRSLECRTFFEIGTNRGRTAWTVARNNPQCRVYTLDLPAREAAADVQLDLTGSDHDFFVRDWDRGEAFAGTEEEDRITTLQGDSATFDYTPYAGRMDFVFVDGAHSYAYVRNDTERALALLAPGGTIAWDDYPAMPGVYRYLNELAGTVKRPMYHVRGTRLVVLSHAVLAEPRAAKAGHRIFAA
jgi:predicted O-methyltransferase YrrM